MQSNNISKAIFLAISLTIFISIFSCKKDSSTTTTTNPATPTGTLVLHLHTNVDSNEVDFYDTVYHTTAGRKISVSRAQLFISHIQAVQLNGAVIDLSGISILKVMENEEYVIGKIPVGNYKSVNFSVGLDNTVNTTAPTVGSIFNNPTMWFNSSYASSDGYVFANFQGKIDTTTHANGTVTNMQPFVYKIGTNAHFTNINMPEQDFAVLANTKQYVHIIIDYNKFFNGVPLNQSANLNVSTAAANSTAIGNLVAANIVSLFHYEQ